MIYVKTHVVARCKAGGGRSAQEHLVPALPACTGTPSATG